jgi:hypothetical protein
MDWIDMAQDRDRWQALVSAVMNLGVSNLCQVRSVSVNSTLKHRAFTKHCQQSLQLTASSTANGFSCVPPEFFIRDVTLCYACQYVHAGDFLVPTRADKCI